MYGPNTVHKGISFVVNAYTYTRIESTIFHYLVGPLTEIKFEVFSSPKNDSSPYRPNIIILCCAVAVKFLYLLRRLCAHVGNQYICADAHLYIAMQWLCFSLSIPLSLSLSLFITFYSLKFSAHFSTNRSRIFQ